MASHSAGWETSIARLVATGPEGKEAIRTAIDELVAHGYLVRGRARDATGKLAGGLLELRVPEPPPDVP